MIELNRIQQTIDLLCLELADKLDFTLIQKANINLEYVRQHYPDHYEDMNHKIVIACNSGIRARNMEYFYQGD